MTLNQGVSSSPALVCGQPEHFAASPFEQARYVQSGSPRVLSFLLAAGINIALLYALLTYGAAHPLRHERTPLVVNLLPLSTPAPPAPQQRHLADRPTVVAPTPLVAPPPITPVVMPISTPPAPPAPPQPEVEKPAPTPAEPPARAPATGPVAVDNLATRLISATPPRYPTESRRARETGTVVLFVTVSEDGTVEDVTVRQSSGFDRLDRAALGAVRKWRWSPTTDNGRKVRVQGLVRIPFELRG